MMAVFQPSKSSLLHVEVINEILNAIVSGNLKPGDRIIEQSISEQMEISRAPVREAIRELAAHDIIKVIPRKGAYIAQLEPQGIKEVYLLRSCLEGLAARLVTNRLDDLDLTKLEQFNEKMKKATLGNEAMAFVEADLSFHDLIYQKCGHARLIKVIEGVRIQTRLYMIMSKWHLVAHAQLNRERNAHQPILDAFKSRNEAAAETKMRDHIIGSGNLLIEYIQLGNFDRTARKEEEIHPDLLKFITRG
jgi:DNA-binding GntR family transcriptional regulator